MARMTLNGLEMAYTDTGPRNGPAVLLLHGWPDDASTWDAVVSVLAGAGLRVIVPTLRGVGETRFRRADIPRTGDSAILALDAIALMDALGITRFQVAGHDWGSNIAEALAVGWPTRVERMAMLSTPPRLGGMPTPSFAQAQRQWYHWFMATARGAQAVRDDRKGFAHIHWTNWSPPGWFDQATFDRVATSFENPDWAAVTIHSYRARWDEAKPDPAGRWLAERIKAKKSLSLPTLYIHGDRDGVNPPLTADDVAAKFTGPFARITLTGVGHFPQRERPEAVAQALRRLFTGDTSLFPAEAVPAKPVSLALGVAAIGLAVAVAGIVGSRRQAAGQ